MNRFEFTSRGKLTVILISVFVSFAVYSSRLFAAEATPAASQTAKTDEKAASSTGQAKVSETKQTSPPLPTVLVSKESYTKAESTPSNGETVESTTEETAQEPEKSGNSIELPKEKTSNQKQKASESNTGLLTSKAAPLQEAEMEMATKTIRGEVSAKGPMGVAVVYEKDEKEGSSKEIYLPFESNMKLAGYANKKDIREGDRVTLTYGEPKDKSKRVLKEIRLEKRMPKQEETEAIPEEKAETKGES